MTAETDPLVVSLRECIDRDEQVAMAAEPPDRTVLSHEWHAGGGEVQLMFANGSRDDYRTVFCGAWERILITRDDGTKAKHIAHQNPARALREVRAKREVLDAHRAMSRLNPGDCEWGMPPYEESVCFECHIVGTHEVPHPCRALLRLAAVYDDQPGWREEWRL